MKDKERRKRNQTIDKDLTRDIECYDDVHNGRNVRVCECTTDFCNAASELNPNTTTNKNVIIKLYLLASLLFALFHSQLFLPREGYI